MDGISHVRALLGRTSYDIGVAPHIPNRLIIIIMKSWEVPMSETDAINNNRKSENFNLAENAFFEFSNVLECSIRIDS
jgi:hypothetical protein